jgi:hypothetical protein
MDAAGACKSQLNNPVFDRGAFTKDFPSGFPLLSPGLLASVIETGTLTARQLYCVSGMFRRLYAAVSVR